MYKGEQKMRCKIMSCIMLWLEFIYGNLIVVLLRRITYKD